jgi:IclR family transcriptional regulator, KDG regulon repressor
MDQDALLVSLEVDMPAAGEKYFFISSLAKGLKILELLAKNETMTVTGVSESLGINRASSHRFLATLRELDYVDKDENAKYCLTFKVMELSMQFLGRLEILNIARPFLKELSASFNETVNLGFFNGKKVVHIDKIDSPELLKIDASLGTSTPAYCTALGKTILAHLPPKRLEDYFANIDLRPLTPHTVTSKDLLLKELANIRENGYAIDDEELVTGLRCIGAPVFDHTGRVRYAVSVSSPAVRMGSKRTEETWRKLLDVCQRFSKRLGNISD